MDVWYRGGLHLEFSGEHFLFDPLRKFEKAFITHAHSDHASGLKSSKGAEVGASPLTLSALREKYHPDFREFESDIKMLPAGHIMGSCQFLIEDGLSLLYTGDMNYSDQLSCPKAEVHDADVLIIEATWGKPTDILPDPCTVREEIISFVDEKLAEGRPVVFYGYPAGKAQELTDILKKFNLFVDKDVKKMNDVYGLGQKIDYNYLPPGLDIESNEWVGIFSTSQMRQSPAVLSKLHGTNIPAKAVASGWAGKGWFGGNVVKNYEIEGLFPLSSHSDFPNLLRFVEDVDPGKVYTVFGEKEIFASELKKRGFDAECVRSEPLLQKKLFAC